jgi:hypothetical protein
MYIIHIIGYLLPVIAFPIFQINLDLNGSVHIQNMNIAVTYHGVDGKGSVVKAASSRSK